MLRLVWIVIVVGGCASVESVDAGADAPFGAARVHWRVVDRARDPCRCRDVGAGVVDVIARGPGPIYEERFECLQELAVTGPLAPGAYAIELRLETDDGVGLGVARGDGVIDGALVDLGTFELEVQDGPER